MLSIETKTEERKGRKTKTKRIGDNVTVSWKVVANTVDALLVLHSSTVV
jgi:hypothetical protein